ncbi:Aldo/keto reductase [Lentinus tigrinus ALCF2SS1-6]|uniref:Aldo/keto reductase n=1 Tax=Lentinus tigrinus ALCF2SS1-6 TaxID=1328759 RepID=A0A5C2S777_9APHY|nr:Aldo/keto reductase [Lentinus tigrinus ALCF2SS1-6]
MADVPKFKLNTRAEMPAIGLGAWAGTTQERRREAWRFILSGLKSGYRLIDTAWNYGTEKGTAEAIRKSGIPRSDVWITTKLHYLSFNHQHHGPYVEEFFEESLKNLETDYVDLYLLHWPQHSKYVEGVREPLDDHGDLICYDIPIFNETWARMEKLYNSGRAKAIGVSNFSVKNLKKLLETAKVVPAVNQVEMHPYLAQQELKDFCDDKGIVLTAYTPTGRSPPYFSPSAVRHRFNEIAEKYKVSPAQIILSWHVARGVSVVRRSSNEQRQKDNFNLPKLDTEDIKRIDALDRNQRICNAANERGKVWGWTYEQLGR